MANTANFPYNLFIDDNEVNMVTVLDELIYRVWNDPLDLAPVYEIKDGTIQIPGNRARFVRYLTKRALSDI